MADKRRTRSAGSSVGPIDAALARQAALLDHVFDPVIIWRLPGPIIYWNDAARALYGYTREEAIGRASHDLLRTEFPNGLTPADIEAAVAHDGEWSGQVIHWSKNGQRLVIDSRHRATLLSGDDSRKSPANANQRCRVVLETARDVTERRGAQEESARHARQQESIAVLGRAALERDDLSALMREAVERVVGELEVPYAQISEFVPAGRSFVFQAGSGRLLESLGADELSAALSPQSAFTVAAGEPVIVPDMTAERRFLATRLLRKVGAASSMSVVIRAHPEVLGVLAVVDCNRRDFTSNDALFLRAVANVLAGAIQNDRVKRALQDRGARMAAVVDTALEGIITIDERGIIESVNPAACQMFGYPREEVVGRNVRMLMPEPFCGEHDSYIRNYLRTGQARIIGIGREVAGLRKDGSIFPIHLGVSEFRIGGTRMFTGQVRDITERRRLEREILEVGSQEQLRIGQDLHDGLCQELTGVSFALQVLGQKLAARTAPETASIRKIAELVDQSMSHARALAHGLQPVTLDASGLESALQELAAKTQRLFRVSCLLVSDGPVLVHDNLIATHVYRIAQEAIGNALKHGKAKTIALDLGAQRGQLHLTISDDGVGLQQTSGDGKGIGLRTMAYRASVVGGMLDIRPGERGGTVVTCTIPLRQAVVDSGKLARVSADGGKIQKRQPAAKAKNIPRRRSPDRPRAPGRAHRPGSGS